MILKKDSGDEHKFCMTLMEKTVRGIGILNSDLFSDQFFLQCAERERNRYDQRPGCHKQTRREYAGKKRAE
jgi:hypothetical protein